MNNPIASKNTAFLNKIRSQQRQKIFAQERVRLEQARMREDAFQINAAQNCLIEMFDGDRQEYQFAMEMADRLEKQEREFQEYLERLQQESMNLEAIQKQKDIEEMRKQLYRRLLQQQDEDAKQ